MGETRAYNLRAQQSTSCRWGGILWLMRDNNIKWTVNKYTSIEPWAGVAVLPGKKKSKKQRQAIYTYADKCPFKLYEFKRVGSYSEAICNRCVQSSYWHALILHGSSSMCYWLHCWIGSLCVKGQFLMPCLDKLYFKVPVIICHALWVIRLYGALALV